ncbi:MAG TPA: HEAT repeat domain-containing protein, partial [Chthoniobacteraceae bacterium]|nr:HEAT repeat domain-containing protein [Chthoniobacteraceae bacterium]
AFGVAENVCSPLLLGPGALILLPRRLVAEGASPDARAALAHELVHVRQGDWHWSQWLHLVGVLTWPLPLVWFLRRAHDASGELVCDHVAANSVGGAESYAGSLARQSLHAIGRPISAGVPMLRKSGIRHRIELLLSGVKLPSLSWRVTLCAGILTLLSAGLLGGLQLARAADKAVPKTDTGSQTKDVKAQFEKLARESSYFEINDILRNLTEFSTGGTTDSDAKYAIFVAHFRAIHASKEALAPLLTHENPKVRTLAIAALAALDDPTALPYIADLLSDDAATFARSGSDQRPGSQLPNGPASNASPRAHVSVGENAQAAIAFYLDPAKYYGYDPVSNGRRTDDQKTRKEFAEYWSKHKDRAYCASWFAERLARIVYSNSGAVRDDQKILGGIRADLDKVPQPDRAWIALWLNGDFPNALYSDKELADLCAKPGPDALMTALQKHQYPGDDPDLQRKRVQPASMVDPQMPDTRENDDFQPAEKFILKNDTALLRPQDAQTLVQLYTWFSLDNRGGAPVPGTPEDAVAMTRKNTPLAFIAAARLQPGKAVEILRPAYAQFMGDSLAYDRCELDAALWELGGESQTAFITDQFYYEAGHQTAPMYGFIDQIAAIEKPPGRKLIAAILRDKRLDGIDVDGGTLSSLAKAVNGWANKQVVSKDEVRKAGLVKTKDWRPDPSTRNLRTELLDRLRESAPDWADSTASADEVQRQQAPPAQKVDVKKEFEAIAAMSDYFEISDVIHARRYFSTGGTADENAKYQAMMKRFLAVNATEEELLPLLKHDDPKVRTLAIAALIALPSLDEPKVLPAIAGLLSDDAHTFNREGSMPQSGHVGPSLTDVSVANNAGTALAQYLSFAPEPAGRQVFPERWKTYWDARKGRAWCASWFAVRLRRISFAPVVEDQLSEESRIVLAERDARLHAIRADLDKVPEPERTWTALWLNEQAGAVLYTDAELLDMCRKFGPDAWMNAFEAQRIPGDDPDLQFFGESGSFAQCVRPVLDNASQLLRPGDAAALAAIGAKSNSPLWVIAAARLQPEKAGDILRAAYPQFHENGDDQQRILLALWESGGAAQAPFIVDRFYDMIQKSNDSSGSDSGDDLVPWIAGTKNPPGQKLIAAILQDKRIDALQNHGRIVVPLARAVNGWAGKPVVSDDEIAAAQKGVPMKMTSPLPQPDLALRIQLLHRMRDTAGEWNK